jgi:hypothetical protein
MHLAFEGFGDTWLSGSSAETKRKDLQNKDDIMVETSLCSIGRQITFLPPDLIR